MNALTPHTETSPLDSAAMRETALAFTKAGAPLPRFEDVQRASAEFSRNLWQLIDRVGRLAARQPREAVAAVAMAGVAEAERRLHLMERPGLAGERERVTLLARSVIALCDHHGTLTGLKMCLACDQPIGADDGTLPYDQLSPSGGATRSGRIHQACANRVRTRS